MGTSKADAIRPFSIHVPDEALVDLRRRINVTNWPEQEAVTDASRGVQLATTRELARYWETKHDWRKVEARLNALPRFITEIDGLDIHFIHKLDKGGHFTAWEQPQLFQKRFARASDQSANRSEGFGARVVRADFCASAAASTGI